MTYIVLVNYNTWIDTIECIESVLKSDHQDYQIVVVDNGSENNSIYQMINWAKGKDILADEDISSQLNHVSKPFEKKPLDFIYYSENDTSLELDSYRKNNSTKPIIFIEAENNRGFAAGNNIGIKYAKKQNNFEYIWMLNNDTVIEKSTLSILINYARKQNLGITGSTLKNYDDPDTVQAYGGHMNKFLGTDSHIKQEEKIKKKLDYIIGASLLIQNKVIEKIGLIPENYFLYFEETDYCFNAKKEGFKLDVCIESIVYHKGGQTTKRSTKIANPNEKMDLLVLKNRIYFHRKYLGGGIGLYITISLILLNRIRRKQFNLAKKMFKEIFQVPKINYANQF